MQTLKVEAQDEPHGSTTTIIGCNKCSRTKLMTPLTNDCFAKSDSRLGNDQGKSWPRNAKKQKLETPTRKQQQPSINTRFRRRVLALVDADSKSQASAQSASRSFSVYRELVSLRASSRRPDLLGDGKTSSVSSSDGDEEHDRDRRTSLSIKTLSSPLTPSMAAVLADLVGQESTKKTTTTQQRLTCDDQIGNSDSCWPATMTCDSGDAASLAANKCVHEGGRLKTNVSIGVTMNNSNYVNNGKVPTANPRRHNGTTAHNRHRDSSSRRRRQIEPPKLVVVINVLVIATVVATALMMMAIIPLQLQVRLIAAQTLQTDPRPTIYSGQISFGLLLSAHSSPGAELSTAASSVNYRRLSRPPSDSGTMESASSITELVSRIGELPSMESNGSTTAPIKLAPQLVASTKSDHQLIAGGDLQHHQQQHKNSNYTSLIDGGNGLMNSEPIADLIAEASKQEDDNEEEDDDEEPTSGMPVGGQRRKPRAQSLERRQIFERPSPHQVRRQQQQALEKQQALAAAAKQHQASSQLDSACSQVNPSSLYAGMGAIWASHQANLVGDSQLAIGTYVYDSCNDLEIGQRQSVRIVSNLNAFQQTTCESPRGSPISLTIAHGENQLRAIQLLTSFRVPVITTKEPFALEDYHLLTKDQRRFLFSTAPSSRHLAVGALKFTKRVVSRSAASPKLPNQYHKMSSKNGLIVISRNLPAKFIAYLAETIPNQVNYEMLQTSQPIDQVRSVEALESILMLNAKQNSGSHQSSASSSQTASNQESRVSVTRTAPSSRRFKRNQDDQESGGSNGGSSDSDSDSGEQQQQQHRMLSPTILMFITPSEAIDLVTRLRNDLAEVSRYYSLVVTTREDISPALKTIFHRGGSRLCSGKAFYTISPKPDEVHEFSRYFRDTVQMEGENSDHPLICEFAKHQSGSKMNADLDDISTEAVIKAVWSAAAAFKLVHKRECSAALGSPGSSSSSNGNLYTSSGGGGGNDPGLSSRSLKQGRRQSQTMAGTSGGASGGNGNKALTPHAECLIKMNKNMAYHVQRALKKLDVHINSTGLQSLDGFRIKFDETNELLTNKFSIKYINKECEITELGEYSGTGDSKLHFHENESVLLKSLESILPDPWPVAVTPPPAPPVSPASSSSSTPSSPGSSVSTDLPSSSTSNSSQDDTSGAADSAGSNPADSSSSSSSSDDSSPSKNPNGDEEQDSTSGADNDKLPSIIIENEAPKRRRSNAKLAKRKTQEATSSKQQQTVMMSNSRNGNHGFTPGLTDFATEAARSLQQTTTLAPAQTSAKRLTTNGPSLPPVIMTNHSRQEAAVGQQAAKPMRKLKPIPAGKGVALKEWLPKQQQQREETGLPTTSATTTARMVANDKRTTGDSDTDANNDDDDADDQESEATTSTTRAPALMTASTLPESGGNTDLDMPAFKPTSASRASTPPRKAEPSSLAPTTTTAATTTGGQKSARSSLDTSASTTTELATTSDQDYVTLPSIVRTSTQYQQQQQDPRYGAAGQLEGGRDGRELPPNATHRSSYATTNDEMTLEPREPRLGYLRDLNNSPIPLPTATTGPRSPSISDQHQHHHHSENSSKSTTASTTASRAEQRSNSRSRLRSHLKWIYSSWFTLAILGANICGALMTLYVLTFLLVKNCDGVLDRENQGIRSMHLLSIIVVFFGSTLFIVYPTPSLCLLRSSWHNFALVLMFGSLLLQTMQTRSVSSIGLGGRPNRLNQLLTLLFMVGVQVSFELQRWKYESANYVNFVNQYFSSQENGDKKLLIFSNSIAGQFNPLNSFNDQVTPVSIQVSEKYQNLLHDYCTQPVEDFLQGQFYLWLIMGLLIVFSISNRRTSNGVGGGGTRGCGAGSRSQGAGGLLAQARGKRSKRTKFQASKTSPPAYTLTSGKLLASQHETNELMTAGPPDMSPTATQTFGGSGPFSVGSKVAQRHSGDVFLVTLISVPIYFISIILHVHGQNLLLANHHDLVASVTMVLIAFTVLIGIFLPVLRNYHRFGELVSGPTSPSSSSSSADHHNHHGGHATSLSHPILGATTLAAARKRSTPYRPQGSAQNSPLSGAFAMFPEFASTGLRRPSSIGGDSLGRRPFAETKESRRNMGLSLANLPPEPDSLRSLCVNHNNNPRSSHGQQTHNHHNHPHQQHRMSTCSEQQTLADSGGAANPTMTNLRLSLSGVDEESPNVVDNDHHQSHHHNQHHQHHHHHQLNETLAHNKSLQQQHNGHKSHQPHQHHAHHSHNHHRKSQPPSSRRSSISSAGEKRLIMLDVDPCCPRHGVANSSSPVS